MKYLFFILALLMVPVCAYSGDGHEHGETAFVENSKYAESFELSDKMIKNLDIKTYQVQKYPLQEAIELPCVIRNPAEQSSLISVNYMSRVEKIHVSLGDKVKKGQTLFTVFSYIAVRNIEIKSPIDGVVSAQNVKIGQVVQQDMTLAEISTMKYFYAEGMAYLSDDISHIKIGDNAKIMVEGTHEDINGKVKNFSPIVNPDTKNKMVLVYFEVDDNHIFPNMHCKMNIYMGENRDVLAVPKRAILGEFGHYFIFLKYGQHFDRREVVVGLDNGVMVEIVEGLNAGDEVVVQGNYQLQFVNPFFSSEAEETEHSDGEKL